MNISIFKDTYKKLQPEMNNIIASVLSSPAESRNFAKHIDRLGAITQYAYYVSLVRRYLSDEDSFIVDWGGQYGQVTKLMQAFYPKTECYLAPNIEVSDNSYWHERLNVRPVKHGQVYNRIDYSNSSVDAVLSSGVLEHVHESNISEQDAIAEVHRILKNDGLFFIWNLPYLYGSVELLNASLGRWHHDRRYKKSDILEILKSNNFEILFVDHHEFLNMMSRSALGSLIGHGNAFIVDYVLSKTPPFNLLAQHFTLVARKTSAK